MTAIALGVALIALVVSLIALAAMVEMYAGLGALREALKGPGDVVLLDEVTKTVIARDPADVGIPVPRGVPAWYVLVVSPHCGTCSSIVADLAKDPPLFTSIIVAGVDHDDAKRWLAGFGVGEPDAFLIDPEPGLLAAIGLAITPSIIVVIEDELAFVAAIDSIEALNRIVIDKFVPPEALALRAGVSSHDQHPTIEA